eukprot:18522-Pelagococcus_subviridis.AAC.5
MASARANDATPEKRPHLRRTLAVVRARHRHVDAVARAVAMTLAREDGREAEQMRSICASAIEPRAAILSRARARRPPRSIDRSHHPAPAPTMPTIASVRPPRPVAHAPP